MTESRTRQVLEYKVFGGDDIEDAIKKAKVLSRQTYASVFMVFNGVALCVHPSVRNAELLADYDDALAGMGSKKIRQANLRGAEYWPDVFERRRSPFKDLKP